MLLPEATTCQIKSPVVGIEYLPSSCWSGENPRDHLRELLANALDQLTEVGEDHTAKDTIHFSYTTQRNHVDNNDPPCWLIYHSTRRCHAVGWGRKDINTLTKL